MSSTDVEFSGKYCSERSVGAVEISIIKMTTAQSGEQEQYIKPTTVPAVRTASTPTGVPVAVAAGVCKFFCK